MIKTTTKYRILLSAVIGLMVSGVFTVGINEANAMSLTKRHNNGMIATTVWAQLAMPSTVVAGQPLTINVGISSDDYARPTTATVGYNIVGHSRNSTALNAGGQNLQIYRSRSTTITAPSIPGTYTVYILSNVGPGYNSTPAPSATLTVTPPSYSCTGTVPSNSNLCSGDSTGLTGDTTRTAVNSCTTGTKCEYRCNAGYERSGNNCVPISYSCTGTRPANSWIHNSGGDATGLTANLSWQYQVPNSPRKCEFGCNGGYSWNGSTCAPNVSYSCTGSIPSNGSAYFGETSGLTGNLSWQYSSSDTSRQCEFRCNSGYTYSSGSCVPDTPPPPPPNACAGSIPSNASVWDANETTSLPFDGILWQHADPDTGRKCEYRCNNGYTYSGGSCVVSTPAPGCGYAAGIEHSNPPSIGGLCWTGTYYWTDDDGDDGDYNWWCYTGSGPTSQTAFCSAPKTPPLPIPDPPVVSGSCNLSGNAQISWPNPGGATSYQYRVDNSTANNWNGSCSGPNPGDFCGNYNTVGSFSFGGQLGSSYTAWVHACNASGCSSASAAETFSCPVPAPDRTLTVIYPGDADVTSNPSGISCGDGSYDCNETYPDGTSVNLDGTIPNGDVDFAGDCSGNCDNLIMDDNKTVTVSVTCDADYTWDGSSCIFNRPDLIPQVSVSDSSVSVDEVNGIYNNLISRVTAQNINTGDFPSGGNINYRSEIDYGADGSVDDTVSSTFNSGVSGNSSTLLSPQVFNNVPFGGHEICVQVNDPPSTISAYNESDYTNNDTRDNGTCATFTLSPVEPPMVITADNQEDTIYVRQGDDAVIDWDVNTSYPMDCEVTGQGNTVGPFDPSVSGTGTTNANNINNSTTYTLTCTEPNTNTDFTETVTIEVIPVQQEI